MASGNTMAVFGARDGSLPASSYALLAVRDVLPVAEFNTGVDWAIYFEGVLPSSYAGGGVTVDVYWMGKTATSGNTIWEVAWERGNEGNIDFDSASWGTVTTSGTSAANGTSGKKSKVSMNISHANMGSPSAGDPFRLRVRRMGTNGSDNMSGYAQLVDVHVKEQ